MLLRRGNEPIFALNAVEYSHAIFPSGISRYIILTHIALTEMFVSQQQQQMFSSGHRKSLKNWKRWQGKFLDQFNIKTAFLWNRCVRKRSRELVFCIGIILPMSRHHWIWREGEVGILHRNDLSHVQTPFGCEVSLWQGFQNHHQHH